MNIGGVAIASGSGSRSQSNRDRNCWSKTLEPVAALALPLERREQFLLIEALSGCSLEVHPPHDPLTIDQELPNDERLLLVSFQVLPIALDRLESIEAQDRVVSLTRDGWDPNSRAISAAAPSIICITAGVLGTRRNPYARCVFKPGSAATQSSGDGTDSTSARVRA
jgi:hypothetical protein